MLLFFKKEALAAFPLGVLAALALPPFFLLPTLLLAIPGLLLLIGRAGSVRAAAWRGFAFGMGYHLLGLYWITNAVLVMAKQFWWAVPLAVPVLSAYMALFIAIPCALAWFAPAGLRRAVAFAGLWVLGDVARQFALSGFPWNPLGSVWELPGGLVFMQPAAWVGVHGLTGATLLLVCLAFLGLRGRLAAAALLSCWIAVGVARLHRPTPAADGLQAVIVQGNVSEIEHNAHLGDQAFADASFSRHLALTREGMARAGSAAALVVWAETAGPDWLDGRPPARREIAQAAGGAIASLVGTMRAEPRGDGYAFFNSLVAVLPDGGLGAVYDKHHLVPYGEYFPSYLPLRLGETGFQPGPGVRTLHVPGLPALGPLICYESIFPAEVVREEDRPRALVLITNDAWFGNSTGPRQHLAAARMRAVEEGLPVVRAANTGISALIDGRGRVVSHLGLNRAGVLVGPIPAALPPTPASRMGLAAPLLLALASVGAGFGYGRRTPPHASGVGHV